MKRSYLFFIVVLLCSSAFAQSGSRLTSFAQFGYDTTIGFIDTGRCYYYSADHGGAIMGYEDDGYEMLCNYPAIPKPGFDLFIGIQGVTNFDSTWQANSSGTEATTQTFDINGNKTTVLWKHNVAGTWVIDEGHYYLYDANHNILQYTDTTYTAGVATPKYNYAYTYDTSNRLLTQMIQGVSGGMWQNLFYYLYSYDNSGKLVLIRQQDWVSASLSWEDATEIAYHYQGAILDTSFSSTSFGSGFIPQTFQTHYFSPGNDTMITNVYGGGDNYLRMTNVYDSRHNKVQYLFKVLDSSVIPYDLTHEYEWAYNSYDQVINEKIFNNDLSGNLLLNAMFRFYYELYTPASTKRISIANNNIAAYPSPTKNLITLKLEWNDSRPFSIGIYDMNGRMVKQWTENAANSFAKTLPIPGLAAGNYIIKATNGAQEQTGRFVVGN